MKRNVILSFLLLVGICTGANAQEVNPCSKEMMKYCKKMVPGTVAMMDCLEQHEKRLSAACKKYEEKMGGPRMENKETVKDTIAFGRACQVEIAQYCKNAGSTPAGVMDCLKSKKGKLSALCDKSLKGMNE
ncbi:MAG: hypothetical protein WCQ53_01140 [bacterium]